MNRVCLGILFMFFAFNSFAQTDFRPGYIIQKGDTIKGWVNYQRPKKSARACKFKTESSAKVTTLTPFEIEGYGFDEGIHFRKLRLKETAASLPNKKKAPKDYFVNVLVSGKAALFFTYDIAGKARFFVKKDTVFSELETRENTIKNEKDGSWYKVKSKLYLGTLTYLFKDCPSLQPQINKTSLKKNSLSNTFTAYNRCIHPDSLYFVQKIKRSVTTFGFSAGPNYTFMKFYPEFKTTEVSIDNSNKPGFSAGAFLNSTLPFINEKVSLNTGLFFYRTNFKAKYKLRYDLVYFNNNNNGQTVTETLTYFNTLNSNIELNSLKLPIEVRYTSNFKKVCPYLGAGIIYNYDMQVKEKGTLTIEINNNQQTKPISGYHNTKFYIGVTASAGLQYKLDKRRSVFIDFKYIPENFLNLYDLDARARTVSLNTGFMF